MTIIKYKKLLHHKKNCNKYINLFNSFNRKFNKIIKYKIKTNKNNNSNNNQVIIINNLKIFKNNSL